MAREERASPAGTDVLGRLVVRVALAWLLGVGVAIPGAAAAVPFALPPGESDADWATALGLAGFEPAAAGGTPSVRLVALGASWDLHAVDSRGREHVVRVARPTSARSREDVVWLAQSLIHPGTSALGALPGLPVPLPPDAEPEGGPGAEPEAVAGSGEDAGGRGSGEGQRPGAASSAGRGGRRGGAAPPGTGTPPPLPLPPELVAFARAEPVDVSVAAPSLLVVEPEAAAGAPGRVTLPPLAPPAADPGSVGAARVLAVGLSGWTGEVSGGGGVEARVGSTAGGEARIGVAAHDPRGWTLGLALAGPGRTVPEALGADVALWSGFAGAAGGWTGAGRLSPGLVAGPGISVRSLATAAGAQTAVTPALWVEPSLGARLWGPLRLRVSLAAGVDLAPVSFVVDGETTATVSRTWFRPAIGVVWGARP